MMEANGIFPSRDNHLKRMEISQRMTDEPGISSIHETCEVHELTEIRDTLVGLSPTSDVILRFGLVGTFSL